MFKSQVGQVLALTLLVTGLGSLSTGAMLGIITSSSRSSGAFQDSAQAYYAAASGIEAVMADLVAGKDALAPSYTVPSVTLNGHTVAISIAPPQVDVTPRAIYRYIDPGAGDGLAALAPKAVWRVKLNGVEPFSSLLVNWSFLPQDDIDLEIRVFDASGKEVAEDDESSEEDAPATLVTRLGSGDTYFVEFDSDEDSNAIISRAFSARGGQDNTWILVKSTGKDYLITSTAGEVALQAYVRQIPGLGPTSPPIKQTVVVESWQGPLPPPPTPPPTPSP